MNGQIKEGSLKAPTRHPIDWQSPDYLNRDSLYTELERVFDICHGCRRCVNLCNAFPTLFDLVDASSTMEVDGVAKADYIKVVDHCYLCDLCYLTKCPYVPPHEWNVDFPHLMLRAKTFKFNNETIKKRDKILTNTDQVGRLAGIPIVVEVVNGLNQNKSFRKSLDKFLGVHQNAVVPKYHNKTARKRLTKYARATGVSTPIANTTGKVALFTTCYGNYNEPQLVEDLAKVLEHNKIAVTIVAQEKCCGMPKLELGDLSTVEELKNYNASHLLHAIEEGWDIIAPVPSCVLMFKQELPLLFASDAGMQKIKRHIFDPFEYLMIRNKEGALKTDFKNKLGKIAYHASCHLRVQNIGLKTRDVLNLVPETQIELIERCSGHDGTYAVKSECHDIAMKICRPIITKIKSFVPNYYTSDCPIAGHHIEHGLRDGSTVVHPISLLRHAYGI